MNVAHISLGHKLMRYFRDPAVATWRKLAGFLAVLYVVSPVDAIPDFFPVVGWLDDFGVIAAAATFMVREITRHSGKSPREPATAHKGSVRKDAFGNDIVEGEVVEKGRRR